MLAIPDGFRIASAYVDVSLNQDELLRQIGEVEAELSDLSGTIKFDIDQNSLAAAIEKAKAAFASQAGAMPITFDISDASLLRAIETAKEAFAAQDGVIPVTFDVSQASMLEAVEKAKAFFGVNPATMPVKFDVDSAGALSAGVLDMMLRELRDAAADLTAQTTYLDEALTALGIIQRDTADSSADLMMQTELLRVGFDGLDTRLDAVIAHLGLLSGALLTTRSAMGAVNNAAGSGTRSWTIWGQNAATVIHWIISGTAELLAVLVPATVAAGAWAFAWVQGATNVYQHLNALFTATEALGQASGQTYGEMLGLKGVWQQIQNEANPDVYQALGAALNIVKEQFGGLAETGLQVGQIFDTFMAKLVYDFSAAGGAGKTTDEILQNMVPDLTRVGEVFGNLGHFIASAASQMPGLAELLLRILADGIGLASAIAQLAARFSYAGISILTLVMGLEEFNRWGSLVVTVLGKMGLATAELSGGTGSYFLVGDRFLGILKNIYGIVPNLAFGIASLASKIPLFGAAVVGTTEDVEAARAAVIGWIDGLSALQTLGILVVAVGLGILIDKWVTATSAAQNFTAAINKQVEAARGLQTLPALGNALDDLTQRLNQSQHAVATLQASMPALATSTTRAGDAAYGYRAGLAAQASGLDTARAASQTYLKSLDQQAQNVGLATRNAQMLANTYHISVPAAMALAGAANVSLVGQLKTQSGAWTAAGEQIRDYVTGLGAMGTATGMVGNDMLALAIQEGEQGTKVEQLNQAWDSFMQNLTGGTSDLGSFIQAMGNLTNITNTTKFTLSQSTEGMSLSVAQFAKALTGTSQTSAQAWQNFDQVLGSTMPQLTDWFRIAQAEGAATGTQVSQSVLDMAASLVKYAADSKPAQAELLGFVDAAGMNIQTFPQLEKAIKATGASTANLSKNVDQATIKMGDMAQIAENLGDVMSSQVTSSISNASLKASGYYSDVTKLTEALHDNGTVGGHDAAYWANQTAIAYQNAQTIADEATGSIGKNSAAMQHNAAVTAASQSIREKLADDLEKVKTNSQGAESLLEAYTRAVLLNGSNTDATKAQRAQLIKDLANTGLTAKQATTLVNNLTTAVKHIPASGAWELLMTGKGTYTIAQAAQAYTHPAGYQGTGPPVPGQSNAKGGMIAGPGGPTDDKVPAWLSAGEYVVRASSVDKYGKELFDSLNSGHFADGGLVEQGTNVLAGQYITTMQAAMKTTVQNALVGAMLAALHTSEKAAASSGGGGYAGPGGGSASANEALARSLFPFGSSQWQDFVNIAMRESGFSNTAMNPSGAYGIAQALPSSKYPLAGRPPSEGGSSNPTAQITWMFDYIKGRYGTPANAWAHEQCVPLSMDILTQRGWLSYDELQAGDETIGFNPATELSEWTPIRAIHLYDDAPLVRMSCKTWETVCTPSHRWAALHWKHVGRKGHEGRTKNEFRREHVFVETQHINSRYSLRLAAPAQTGEGAAAISEQEAELLGWVLGDGWVIWPKSRTPGSTHWRAQRGTRPSVRLGQSKPQGVKAIDDLVKGLMFTRTVRQQRPENLPAVTWEFHRPYSAELLERSGYDHKNPVPFVLSLSETQRTAFLRGVFGAEGSETTGGTFKGVGKHYAGNKTYPQADGPKQDAITLAVYLSGKRPGVSVWDDRHHGAVFGCAEPRPGGVVRETKPFIGGESVHREDAGRGPVWCVSTDLGTWTMRHGRHVMLTGNSAGWYDKGGLLMPGVTTAVNTTGRPETVLPNSGGINITFNGSQWPGPEQIQAFTLALTSAIAHA